jgi:hypothetical protein
MTTNTNVALLAALEAAHDAIIGMKVEAETAAQGDEQMMLEACEQISNEGLEATTAIRTALTAAAAVPPGERMDARHASIYQWILQNPSQVVDVFSAWMDDHESDSDELHDELARLAAAPKAEPVPAGEYPPLPEWSKMDNLGGLVPSEIRQELRAYADATCAMRAQAAPQPSHTPQADSQPAPVAQGDAEDAARYRWLREHKALNTTHCWHFQGGPIIPGLLTLDAAIDAARKQGANHD